MKIKITHPIPEHGLQAGFVYDLPAKVAREIIKADKGFELKEEKQNNDTRPNNS